MKGTIIDANYYPSRPGRGGRVAERHKRRLQFWAATCKFLATEAVLIAAAVAAGMLLK